MVLRSSLVLRFGRLWLGVDLSIAAGHPKQLLRYPHYRKQHIMNALVVSHTLRNIVTKSVRSQAARSMTVLSKQSAEEYKKLVSGPLVYLKM